MKEDDLNFLLSNGMTAEEIKARLDEGIPMEEVVSAAERVLERRAAFEKIRSELGGAGNVRDLLTESVKEAYRNEASPEKRALIAADLRTIAKAGKFSVEFDAVFSAFKKTVDDEEKPDKPISRRGQRVSVETVRGALRDLGITVKYNQLLKEVEVVGLPPAYSRENAVNILPVYLMDYMRKCGFEGVTAQTVEGCLSNIADMNRYNPIEAYLSGGTWDGVDRFERIYQILGVSNIKYQTYIVKWFVQCVALGLNREENPIGAEGVLVLQGEQGLAKTSFFRIMTPFPRWFVEGAVIDMGNKDTLLTALSGWITELGELDSTMKKEQASLKAFITKPEDRIRPPYGRRDIRSPRRTSFCGTVNPEDYLKDETGSRRFLTIPITNIDKRALFSMPIEFVNQVWYQAYDIYRADPSFFRLSDDEIKELQTDNREFEAPLPFELEILELLDFSLSVSEWEWWRAAEVSTVLAGNKATTCKVDARKVGKALSKIIRNTTPDPPRYSALLHGIWRYLIPLNHPGKSWRELGVLGGDEVG